MFDRSTVSAHIGALWQRLTTGSAGLTNPYQREQARLLATLHLVLIPLAVVISPLRALLDANLTELQPVENGVLLTLLVAGYLLSRSRMYLLAAALDFCLGAVSVLGLALGVPSLLMERLFHLIALGYLSSIFLPPAPMAGLIALTMLLPDGLSRLPVAPTMAAAISFGLPTVIFALLIVQQRRHPAQTLRPEWMYYEQQFRLIADNTHDMIARIELDGRFSYMNAAVTRILGRTVEQSIGVSFQDWMALVHPDDAPGILEAVQQQLYLSGPYELSYRFRHTDGHYVWLESVSRPLQDSSGAVSGIILVTRDITERKAAERQRREMEARLQATIDSVSQSILLIGSDYRIQAFNQVAVERNQWVAGRVMVVGDLVYPFIEEQYHTHFDRVFQAALAGQTIEFEGPIAAQDGSERWYEMRYLPVRDETGQITAVCMTGEDIDGRKQSESQRLQLALERERVRLLRDFIGDLSHDLRTPLATIATSAYLVERTDNDERRQHHLAMLQTQVKHLATMLKDILSLERLEQVDDKQAFEAVSLNVLVGQVSDACASAASTKRQRLFTEKADPDVSVLGNLNRLGEALTNVVTNALTYTPEGGYITLRIIQTAARVGIEVQDTGIGISPLDLPRIFDHFYRADKARSADTGGVGLGLTIAKRILERHGGTITVASEVGQGSTFQLWLPRLTDNRPETAEARVALPSPETT